MKFTSTIIGVLIATTLCSAQSEHPFTYAKPESKGYSSDKLELLKEHLIQSGSSSMIIMIDGDIIFEWGDTGKKHLIHSMRKAILNSLFGIAIHRGQIDTTKTLRALKINDIEPSLTERELDARIADLLKSRSGVYHNAAAVNNGMLIDRPVRGSYNPGEYYYYNNWDFNTLGAILEQQTGQSIYSMFYHEIAKPLGMHDYKGTYVSIDGEADTFERPTTDGYYQYEKSQSKYPAYHFRMSARDLALYGQLFLDYGIWNKKQIIPKDWIDRSTIPYSIYSPRYGNAYGMLWRVRVPNENTLRNSFYHTGLGIHMLGIYPDSKLVMVHRVDTEDDFEYNPEDFYEMISLLSNAKENK
ncbi:MAG: serine hydrolase [Saprospiraceae bacterium]|nr:serine hydrolase [Saprospiraceae bacterium]